MQTTVLAVVVMAVMAVAVSAQDEISMEVTDGKVAVLAEDFILHDPAGVEDDVSVKHLLDELSALRSLVQQLDSKTSTVSGSVQDAIDVAAAKLQPKIAANTQRVDDLVDNGNKVVSEAVFQAIDEAVGGLEVQLNTARATDVGVLEDVVDANALQLVGIDSLKLTVSNLAGDVEQLIEDSANVLACAEKGGHHTGDGNCVPAVRKCDAPNDPTGGTVTVSNPYYIVPGVTARYECTDSRYFVKGAQKRVCSQETFEFDPEAPTCERCMVPNCDRCDGVEDFCGVCKFGHERSPDGKACTEIKNTVFVISFNTGGHNGQESFFLTEGTTSWKALNPRPGWNAVGGTGAIQHGAVHTVDRNGVHRVLPKGGTSWINFPNVPYASSSCCYQSFYATLNGVSVTADGFYMFANKGSSVFQPGSAGTQGSWTTLKDPADPRNDGATVVVGSKIYLLGGYSVSGKNAVDTVSIYDTTQDPATGTYDETSMKLPEPRSGLAATAYGGKIYIFGGLINKARSSSVKAYDLASNTWSTMANMPNPWAIMTAGPMPTFDNGVVLFPGAWSFDGSQTALTYNIPNNQWAAFPKASKWGGRYIALYGTI